MVFSLTAFSSLFSAVLMLLAGVGLLTTLLSLRMTMEGFSVQSTGIIMSFYFLGLVVGSFTCHHLVQRVGHIRAFAVFAAMCCVSALAHGIWISMYAWGFLRLVTGVSITGLYMVIESWLNECTPSKDRGKVFSVYMAITYLGLGVGQFLIMVSDVSRTDQFMIVGMLMCLSLVPVASTSSINPVMPERVKFDLVHIVRKAPLGIAGGFVAGMLNSTIFSLGAVFAFGIGLPVNQISFFMGTIIISGLVLQYPVGILSDRYDRNIVLGAVALIVTFCALMITGYAIVDSSGKFMVLGIMGALYGGFAFTVYPVSVAHTHDFFEPDEIIPVSSALLLSFGVGGVTGPTLASVFMASRLGPKGMFVFLAIVGMCYCAAVFWFRAKRPERLVVEQPVHFVVVRSTSPVAAALDPRSEPVDGLQKPEENTEEIHH